MTERVTTRRETTGPRKAPRGRDSYFRLVKAFPLQSIRTDDELDAATAVMRDLLGRKLDPGGEQYLAALTDLIEVYEARAHPIPEVPAAEVLQLLMEANALTQTELAQKSGIAQSTVSAILAGTRIPTRDHIAALARLFNVSPAAFFDSGRITSRV